jgi:transposase
MKKMISIEVRKLIVIARTNGMRIQEILSTFRVKKTAVYNLFQNE